MPTLHSNYGRKDKDESPQSNNDDMLESSRKLTMDLARNDRFNTFIEKPYKAQKEDFSTNPNVSMDINNAAAYNNRTSLL